MHTMVSDLPSCVQVFNNPSFQASAHFGIAESGLIHQFGPITGWRAWHAMSANSHYYGIEHADAGNPNHPLTPQQITASAQLVELLSRVGNFPLQITNTPGGEGYGTHNMGGASYGGHTCPDLPPNHVRSAQRGEIIALAKAIRAGGSTRPGRGRGSPSGCSPWPTSPPSTCTSRSAPSSASPRRPHPGDGTAATSPRISTRYSPGTPPGAPQA